MKNKFSTSWISSKQPRKQRKYRVNAPLHKKHKFLSSNLSKALREKHSKRSLPLRKGDEVLVMRGAFKKKKAKVVSIDLKSSKVTLEGLQRTKKDGTKVPVLFSSSVLQIQSISSDNKRLDGKSNSEKKSSKAKEEKKKEEKESKENKEKK